MGEIPIDPNDSIRAGVTPTLAKVDQVKFVKPINNAKKAKSTKANCTQTIEEPVYNGGVAIETNAEFPGGIEQFYNFFGKEFKKPENSETTDLKIRLSFAVERNGSVSYLQSVPPIDNGLEQEIKRVLSLCPKWQPGESNGKKATRLYSLPIVLQ